jgi:hypothetical protein
MKRRREEMARSKLFSLALARVPVYLPEVLMDVLKDWLLTIDNHIKEVVSQRDHRQELVMAEVREKARCAEGRAHLLYRLLLYIRDGGRMPVGWKRLPFEELLAFTETLPDVDSYAKMKSIPIMSREEARWVLRAWDALKKEEKEHDIRSFLFSPFPIREPKYQPRSELGGLLFLSGLPTLRNKAKDVVATIQ